MKETIWQFFKEAIGLSFDLVAIPTVVYLRGMKKLSIASLLTVAALVLLSALGLAFKITWPLKISTVLIALTVAIFMVAAVPILTLAAVGYEKLSPIRKSVQIVTGLLFWIFQAMLYFIIVPVETSPIMIPLVLLLFTLIALGFVRFGFGVSPRVAMARVWIILLVVTASCFLPSLQEGAKASVSWLDTKISAGFKSPTQILYTSNLVFFDPVNGKPRVWYYQKKDGQIDLFDRPGFHPIYQEELKPVNRFVIDKIQEQQKLQKSDNTQNKLVETSQLDPAFKLEATAVASKTGTSNGPFDELPGRAGRASPAELLPKLPTAIGASDVNLLEVAPEKPTRLDPAEQTGRQEQSTLVRIHSINLNAEERASWQPITVKAGTALEVSAKGKICWSDQHPQGCVNADGASWTPKSIGAVRADAYPLSEGNFLALLAQLNDGPIFKVGAHKEIKIAEGGNMRFLLNLPLDTTLSLWQGLNLEVKESEEKR